MLYASLTLWETLMDKPAVEILDAYPKTGARLDTLDDVIARCACLDTYEASIRDDNGDLIRPLPKFLIRLLESSVFAFHNEDPRLDFALRDAGVSNEAIASAKAGLRAHPHLRGIAQVRRDEVRAKMQEDYQFPPGTLRLWLRHQSPAMWHEVACGYNWDAEPTLDLGWIVDQPDCDLATALQVFLGGSPDYFVDRESLEDLWAEAQDNCALLDRIAQRVMAGGYKTANYGLRYPEESEGWLRALEHRIVNKGRWALGADVFARLGNQPTGSPFTFHDGCVVAA